MGMFDAKAQSAMAPEMPSSDFGFKEQDQAMTILDDIRSAFDNGSEPQKNFILRKAHDEIKSLMVSRDMREQRVKELEGEVNRLNAQLRRLVPGYHD